MSDVRTDIIEKYNLLKCGVSYELIDREDKILLLEELDSDYRQRVLEDNLNLIDVRVLIELASEVDTLSKIDLVNDFKYEIDNVAISVYSDKIMGYINCLVNAKTFCTNLDA